ncbi:MAG: precorrin-6A reductase [Lachnospiraceae bacterium]|nr:precorrin-6A reductase [Lachnospiraceae bacterium]
METAERLIIFSGTTEGRLLSDRLCAEGLHHIVSVASGYGSDMMREDPSREVHEGRMDAEEMCAFLKARGFTAEAKLIDATHPYAVEVSRNIRAAAEKTGAEYIRVLRKSIEAGEEGVILYDSFRDWAAAADTFEGNILLTTGSKELREYSEIVSEETLKRSYVRVLPSAESLSICSECGVDASHIIAMNGPFGTELNLAILKQYDIAHLVTKESGIQGGFEEKKEAAALYGAKLHVISRPVREEGKELEEVFTLLTGKRPEEKKLKQIILAGMGMGSEASMTCEVREAVAGADIVFGAKRLINGIRAKEKHPLYLAADIIPLLKERHDIEKAVVLFSGDSGFYSGAAALGRALKEWEEAPEIKLLPGVSSVSYLAAALGVNYEDAWICSLHGRNSEDDILAAAAGIRTREKSFVLLSGREDAYRLKEQLLKEGTGAEIFAGLCLSYEEEFVGRLEDMPEADGPVTILVLNRKPERRLIINALPDESFIRGSVPMTKECIRHESIRRLGLREGDLLWDIGGGTGSVSIEAALLHPSIRVCTVERDSEACGLIRENIKKHGVRNVKLIEGDASLLLKESDKPDCVFIGGSGGKLSEILEGISEKGSGIRVVINAISLETLGEITDFIMEKHIKDEEIVQLAVSDIRRVGAHHIPRSGNPVTIAAFTL